MIKKMKKIYLLILFFCCLKSFGQTYSFYLSYTVPTTKFCWDGNYGYTIYGDNNLISQQIKNKTHYQENSTNLEYSDIPNYNIFNITIKSTCFDINGTSSCDGDYTQSISASSFIVNGNLTLYRCSTERLAIDAFMPNVKIQNLKPSSIVCSGENLQLAGFPNNFPNEAYHWQYSYDGISNWTDVPITINNTPQTGFSIYELLGDDHINHFGSIYFRLGYNQNRPFSNVIPITYSPCGPTISNIAFVGPECNGDIVKSLAITFGQKLNSTLGEKLASISVCDINSSKIFMQINDPVSYPDNTKTYTYTTFQNLETGHYYKIRYQAQITDPDDPSKTIMRGVMDSPTALNFLYIDPAKMEFKITNQTQPSCFGGNDGAIEIQILSGQSPYHFYKDGVELTGASQPTFNTGKYYITGLGEKTYSIMVTDSKKCIDKSAND
jgi:hypothetical protein